MKYVTVVVAVVLAVLAMPAPAAAESTGRVLILLTLRGEVPATDDFRLVTEAPPYEFFEPQGLTCGPDSGQSFEEVPLCEGGETYLLEHSPMTVGTELSYEVERNGQTVPGLSGMVVVREGVTRVSLTFDYDLGQLPDTSAPPATPHPAPWASLALLVGALLLTAIGIEAGRRRSN